MVTSHKELYPFKYIYSYFVLFDVDYQFNIPHNGGIYLYSFTIETTQMDVYNVTTVYNRTFPSTYADLLPNNINSILMPCTRGNFYSYRIYATNANKLSARSFSPISDSYFAACMLFTFLLFVLLPLTYFAVYVFRRVSPEYNTIKGGALISMLGDTIPWTPRFHCSFGGDILLFYSCFSLRLLIYF